MDPELRSAFLALTKLLVEKKSISEEESRSIEDYLYPQD